LFSFVKKGICHVLPPEYEMVLDIDNVPTQLAWGCEAVSMHDVVSQHTNLRHTMTLICFLL
jgi:hypothetical protein